MMFPARVGMNRWVNASGKAETYVPRACGDEPNAI